MKIISLILVIILTVPLNAQLSSYNLNELNASKFKNQADPFIRAVALSSLSHFDINRYNNKQFFIGLSYSHAIDLSGTKEASKLMGGHPGILGALLISDNLLLKGNYSIYNSNSDVVQTFAYGLGLNITEREMNNWKLSVMAAMLSGPDDMKLRAMDVCISYTFNLFNELVYLGGGINSSKTNILLNKDTIPNNIETKTNYLILGLRHEFGKVLASPIIKINSKVLTFSIELSGNFN